MLMGTKKIEEIFAHTFSLLFKDKKISKLRYLKNKSLKPSTRDRLLRGGLTLHI
jgi:catabolite regulation protein CreA